MAVSQWIEFTLLGLFAGVLAVWVTETLAWLLYVQVFDIEYRLHLPLWWMVPLLGGLLTGVSGYLSTRGVLRKSPVIVFREL